MTIATTIFGGLALFLFGMKIMSESLQSATGDRLRSILWKVTNNRLKGVLTGFTITSVIQSSSATTVMLVSFVNAGLINVIQATGIILGANIGTTVTGWIVTIIGFKIQIKAFALPAIAVGFFLRFIKNEKLKYWGEVLLGFGILFFGLSIMSGAVKDLRGSEMVMDFMSRYQASGPLSTIMVVLVGTVITMIVQSSSATMAMTMTLAFNGLIDFPTSCALILGENIGTTITANIAAIGSTIAARRAARVHMLFNVFGVVWVLLILNWLFLPFIDFFVPGDAMSADLAIRSRAITDHMAAFHTTFNILNTLLFLPFVGLLAKTAEKMVPEKGIKDEKEFHLKFISTTLLSTSSMNLNQARLEIKRMMGIVLEMYEMVIDVFKNPNKKLGDVVEIIQTKENHTDLLEKEISNFLVKISQGKTTAEESSEISVFLHNVNDLERIADHCESILRLLRRKYDKNIKFSDRGKSHINEISDKVAEFLELIDENITKTSKNIMINADIIENRINELRKEMRKDHIKRLNEGVCDVPSGLIFIDMLTSFEKIGDHSYNIAEGISGLRLY